MRVAMGDTLSEIQLINLFRPHFLRAGTVLELTHVGRAFNPLRQLI